MTIHSIGRYSSSCVKYSNNFYLINCLHFFLNVFLSTILLVLLFLENDKHNTNELKFVNKGSFWTVCSWKFQL